MLKRGKAKLVHHIGFEGFLDAVQDLDKLDQEGKCVIYFYSLEH